MGRGFVLQSVQAVLICIHLPELMGTRGEAVGEVYPSRPSTVKVRKIWSSKYNAPTRLYETAYTTGTSYLYHFKININPTNQTTKSVERRSENSCTSLSIVLWTMGIVQCRTSIERESNCVKCVKNKYVPLIQFSTRLSYRIQLPFLPLRTQLGE